MKQKTAEAESLTAMPTVTVQAPARLHLGFLDLNAEIGRKFGSIGLAINSHHTIINISPAENFNIQGAYVTDNMRLKINQICTLFYEKLGQHVPHANRSVAISVNSAIPEHSGLGSGTQLTLTLGVARAKFHGLSIDTPLLANELGRANDISGGFVDVGRRRYTLRFEGRYEPTQMGEMVLEWRDGSPITLNDIAEIKITRADGANYSVQNGNPAISIRVDRQNNANVLATLEAVKAKVAQINEQDLAPEQLVMAQSFDASVFIYRAVPCP